jgi:FtsP/CotA-like multicopper oxidase with cupredoxin domain
MDIRRRNFLKGAAGGIALATWPRIALSQDGPLIELTAGPSDHVLDAETGEPSALWTYNGMTPGPEIRIRQGERVHIRLRNELEEPTSVHWHGIRIDNAMDGVSGLTQDPVAKGETFDYEFTAPDSGTYWYHAHNRSWNQVARGLYGPLIVEEAEPAFDREHDMTLVIDDWRLLENGALETASFGSLMDWSHAGRLGNWLTVNSLSLPEMPLNRGEACRLRLINAANARVLQLGLGGAEAQILAYDGQPLEEPRPTAAAPLLLGPGQRADLLVVPQTDFALEEVSGNEGFVFARFMVGDGPAAEAESPAIVLPRNDIPEPDLENAKTVRLDMTGGAMGNFGEITYQGRKLEGRDFQETGQVWAFNGVANLAEEPMFAAKRGETVVIDARNDTAWPHAIHTHGHHFRIVARDGAPAGEGRPWRDTFLIAPRETVRIAFVADNPGKWLLHCHMLEHAAAGMNGWFEVG